MDTYIYQADIYCEDCGQAIIDRLRAEARDKASLQVQATATALESQYGIDPDKFPKFFDMLERAAFRQLACDTSDESSYDSDEWPKGPYGNGGGESDCPQHCGDCHEFLENPLTPDGYQYVRENYCAQWDSFYDITREEPGEFTPETEARLEAVRL
jgi:hypothetical protein